MNSFLWLILLVGIPPLSGADLPATNAPPARYLTLADCVFTALMQNHSLQIERLNPEIARGNLYGSYGYYDPIFFLGEGTGNLRNAVLPGLKGSRRTLGRVALAIIEAGASLLGSVVGAGKSLPPEGVRSGAPTGYQIVFRKGAL